MGSSNRELWSPACARHTLHSRGWALLEGLVQQFVKCWSSHKHVRWAFDRAKWLMVKKNHTQYIILGMEKRTTIGLTHIWDSALFPLQNSTGKANICASFSPGPRPVPFIGKIFPDVKNSLPQGTASDSPWREIFTISPKFGVQIRESLQYRWSWCRMKTIPSALCTSG